MTALRLVSDDTVVLRIERARLRGILRAIYLLGGMSAVDEAITAEKQSLAADARIEIAEEGWIG